MTQRQSSLQEVPRGWSHRRRGPGRAEGAEPFPPGAGRGQPRRAARAPAAVSRVPAGRTSARALSPQRGGGTEPKEAWPRPPPPPNARIQGSGLRLPSHTLSRAFLIPARALLVTVGTLRPIARLRVQVPAKIFPLSQLAEFLPLPPPTKSCWVTGKAAVQMYQCLRATYHIKAFFQERHITQSQPFPTLPLEIYSFGGNLFQQHKLLERQCINK